MNLARVQDLMAQAITGDCDADELLGALVPAGALDAAAAVQVYREGYQVRLTEQLGETYATVARVLGEDAFRALAAGYIRGHASNSTNLSDYGRAFPAYLASDGAGPAFLPDLARLELAMHDLFHSAQAAALDAAALAEAAGDEDVRFVLASNLVVLRLEHAALDVFRLRNEDDPKLPDVARPQFVALYKAEGEGRARELDPASCAALEAMQGGCTVAAALERAAVVDASFGPLEASRLFEFVALAGLVVAVEGGAAAP